MATKVDRPILVIHGGAGFLKFRARHQQGLKRAISVGYKRFQDGGTALDAAIEAVSAMEDDAVFNAGRGSVPSLACTVEMDASVMLSNGRSGAVAAIRDVDHPIQVARLVMEQTDHRLLVSDGAISFARRLGFEKRDMLTAERRRLFHRALDRIRKGKTGVFGHLPAFLDLAPPGTVGAIARDSRGFMAAATSTGGMLLHLPGRVGDSPIIGAGTWASELGAASVTGHGEAIWANLVAYNIVSQLTRFRAQAATRRVMVDLKTKQCSCGAISIDHRGTIGIAWNTPGMSFAWTKGKGVTVSA